MLTDFWKQAVAAGLFASFKNALSQNVMLMRAIVVGGMGGGGAHVENEK